MSACDIDFPTGAPCAEPIAYGGTVLQRLALQVRRGSTEMIPVRIETDEWVFRTIESGHPEAPFRATVTGHGLPEVWRAAFMNAGSWRVAATENPPCDTDLHRVVALDVDTIIVPGLNGATFRPLRAPAQLAYRAPLDLSQYNAARAQVRDESGVAVVDWSTGNGRISIDFAQQTLWLLLSDADTEALPAGCLVFDIELLGLTGEVNRICAADSPLLVLDETTR